MGLPVVPSMSARCPSGRRHETVTSLDATGSQPGTRFEVSTRVTDLADSVAASVEVSHELTSTRAWRPPEDTRTLSPTGTALPLREHAQQAMSVSSPATGATTG